MTFITIYAIIQFMRISFENSVAFGLAAIVALGATACNGGTKPTEECTIPTIIQSGDTASELAEKAAKQFEGSQTSDATDGIGDAVGLITAGNFVQFCYYPEEGRWTAVVGERVDNQGNVNGNTRTATYP